MVAIAAAAAEATTKTALVSLERRFIELRLSATLVALTSAPVNTSVAQVMVVPVAPPMLDAAYPAHASALLDRCG